MSLDFIHLHNHSEYSLLDGAMRVQQLISKAKEWNQPAIALTDHGNLFGAIDFYSKCKSSGIKPIIGAEIYIEGLIADVEAPYHLVLLAKDSAGYRNLMKIVSLGYTDGSKNIPQGRPSGVPVVRFAHLKAHGKNLFALSSCYKGELAFLVRQLRIASGVGTLSLSEECEPYQKIKDYLSEVQKLFDPSSFFIELVDNKLAEQQKLNFDLVDVARHFSIEIVATADAHYGDKSYEQSHAVMLAIKSGLTMTQIRSRNKDARFHLLAPDEFNESYVAWPDAITNTVKIAEQCNVKLTFGEFYLPKFPTAENQSLDEVFELLAREMLVRRIDELKELYGQDFNFDPYWARIDYEIKMIVKMGFPGYFLIVQDFINWAKENSIPVGPGRGSGAGSLVAYALRITDLDPLRFNLLFERFLNPERVSMPDFDVDFCQDRRDEVIQYVTEKYGKDRVAQITTFGKMMCKAALRDTGRVLEIGYGKVDRITKMIPMKMPDGRAPTIKDAIAYEPRIQAEADREPNIARMIEIATDIEGLNRQTGVHAAGIVISEGPLTDYVPVYTTPEGDFVTQYEMKNAEKVGMVKFDFLGLKTLTVIDKAIAHIRRLYDPKFDINKISLNEKRVYEQISLAHTVGVFQLEGAGMQNLLVKLKPSSFEDIIAVVALFRPGPLGSGMVDDFIERKHGRQKIIYVLPQLEPILKETYGVILYQEQVQKIASTLANYTPGEADILRRAMGKKIKSEMDAQRKRFLDGASANQIPDQTALELFELMAKFAEYGFNKSHSAAYGLVSYQTAFLKTFYPECYMAACMTCDSDDTDKIIRYVEDCKRMKIKVHPPHINRSDVFFDVPEKNVINFSLAAIKGVGADSVKALIKDREKNGFFKNLDQIAKRVPLNEVGKKNMELMTTAGALDGIGGTRKDLLTQILENVKLSESHFQSKKTGQKNLFEMVEAEEEADHEQNNLDTNQTTRHKWSPAESRIESIEMLFAERKILGCFLSAHPLDLFKLEQKRVGQSVLRDVMQKPTHKGAVPVVVIVNDYQERRTKEGKPVAYAKIEDQTGMAEAVIPESKMPAKPPEKDRVYLCWIHVSKKPDGTLSRPRIDSMTLLEEIREANVKQLSLTIDESAKVEKSTQRLEQINEFLSDLGTLVKTYPGNQALKLQIKFHDATLKLQFPDVKVRTSDALIAQIQTNKFRDVSLDLK